MDSVSSRPLGRTGLFVLAGRSGVFILALLLSVSFDARAQAPRGDDAELWQQVGVLAASGDIAAIESRIRDGVSPGEAARRYFDILRSLYYDGRDLPAVILVARSGIDFALEQAAEAERSGNTEAARGFRGQAKSLAYDLASFTWPGWDEPGIGIRTGDLEVGFEAARLNLRLAEELRRGPEPMANAYFILGGHALAAGDYAMAAEHFRRFREVALEAGLDELAVLAEGYLVITGAARGSGNPGNYMLEPIRMRLRDLPGVDAGFWIDQLETAWNVFVTG